MSNDTLDRSVIKLTHDDDFEKFRKTLPNPFYIEGYHIIAQYAPIRIECNNITFSNCLLEHPCKGDIFFEFGSTEEHFLTLEDCTFDASSIRVDRSLGKIGTYHKLYVKRPKFTDFIKHFQITGNSSWDIKLLEVCNDSIHVRSARYVSIYEALPEWMEVRHAETVYLNKISSCASHLVRLYSIEQLSFEGVHAEQLDAQINESLNASMRFTDSAIARLRVRNCIISSFSIFESYISLISAVDSTSHYFKLNSYAPAAMTNSSGFPQEDGFPIYKKVKVKFPFKKEEIAILKLFVTPAAQKHLGSTGKLRVSEAIPKQLYSYPDLKPIYLSTLKQAFTRIRSCLYDFSYRYYLGKPATPRESFDPSDSDCAAGIHGFLTIDEAKDFNVF